MTSSDIFTLDTPDIHLVSRITPWDTDCFGFSVAQIDTLECLNDVADTRHIQPFFEWLDQHAVRLVSCRLAYDRFIESSLLETCNFRFVESVLHPYLDLPDFRYQDKDGLKIEQATVDDIEKLEAIAAVAFSHGRIHADIRLGPGLGNQRYQRWVHNSLSHPTQQLIKVTNEEGSIIALFITETRNDRDIYWHLTAIAPQYHGQGYGWRVWKAMLAAHARDGMRSVSTAITACNVPILNLYSKLGFRFLPPEITFHWFRVSAL